MMTIFKMEICTLREIILHVWNNFCEAEQRGKEIWSGLRAITRLFHALYLRKIKRKSYKRTSRASSWARARCQFVYIHSFNTYTNNENSKNVSIAVRIFTLFLPLSEDGDANDERNTRSVKLSNRSRVVNIVKCEQKRWKDENKLSFVFEVRREANENFADSDFAISQKKNDFREKGW